MPNNSCSSYHPTFHTHFTAQKTHVCSASSAVYTTPTHRKSQTRYIPCRCAVRPTLHMTSLDYAIGDTRPEWRARCWGVCPGGWTWHVHVWTCRGVDLGTSGALEKIGWIGDSRLWGGRCIDYCCMVIWYVYEPHFQFSNFRFKYGLFSWGSRWFGTEFDYWYWRIIIKWEGRT